MSTRTGLILAVVMMIASACAGMGTSEAPLPPAKTLQPSDLASLAGEWYGTLRAAGAPVRPTRGEGRSAA